jgi:magnesium chelatase family protein
MIAIVKSCTLVGIDAALVEVECTIDRGLPQYSVVGLAAPSVKEGATRIQSALKTVGHDLPLKKVTINLHPPICASRAAVSICRSRSPC